MDKAQLEQQVKQLRADVQTWKDALLKYDPKATFGDSIAATAPLEKQVEALTLQIENLRNRVGQAKAALAKKQEQEKKAQELAAFQAEQRRQEEATLKAAQERAECREMEEKQKREEEKAAALREAEEHKRKAAEEIERLAELRRKQQADEEAGRLAEEKKKEEAVARFREEQEAVPLPEAASEPSKAEETKSGASVWVGVGATILGLAGAAVKFFTSSSVKEEPAPVTATIPEEKSQGVNVIPPASLPTPEPVKEAPQEAVVKAQQEKPFVSVSPVTLRPESGMRVVLKTDHPRRKLRAGHTGTVIHILNDHEVTVLFDRAGILPAICEISTLRRLL